MGRFKFVSPVSEEWNKLGWRHCRCGVSVCNLDEA